MKRKTCVNKKRKGLTKRTRKQRGGGILACKNYYTTSEPKPMDPAPLVKQSHYSLKETNSLYLGIKEIFKNEINDDTLLILKIGSNDFEGSGHAGKKGLLFYQSKLENSSADKVLIVISPVQQYDGYSYPFEYKKDYPETSLFIGLQPDFQRYIQDSFPIAYTEDPKTNEILSLIINHKGPLLLFNAMGSYCYNIFKYIIDMRQYETGYGGYVDNTKSAICDYTKLFPNPEERCKEFEIKQSLQSSNEKQKTTVGYIFQDDPQIKQHLAGRFYLRNKSGSTPKILNSITPDEAYTFLKQSRILHILKNSTKEKLFKVVSKELLTT